MEDKTTQILISKQKVRLFLRLSISIILIGILFKVLHLRYTNLLLGLGTLGVAIFYSIHFYQKKSKSVLDYSKFFLLIAFMLHYIFRVLHWSYGFVFTFIFRGALILMVISYFYDVLFDNSNPLSNDTLSTQSSRRNKLSHLLYVLAGIGIIVGAFFKILHWEFGFVNGTMLLIAGLCCAILSVFMPSNKSEPK